MVAGAYQEIDRVLLTKYDTLDVREQAVEQCVRVMVRTQVETVTGVDWMSWPVAVEEPAPWAGAWWCRVVRRLMRRGVWVPAWLRELVDWKERRIVYKREEWAEELMDRVAMQIAGLQQRRLEPVVVYVAEVTEGELRRMPYGGYAQRIYGLPIAVLPWLAPGQVMVGYLPEV